MNRKIFLTIAFVLLFVLNIPAEPKFSISWENSFLTGAVNLKGEKPDDYGKIILTTAFFWNRCWAFR